MPGPQTQHKGTVYYLLTYLLTYYFGRMIKGAHRRLSADKEPPAQLPPRL